MELIKTKKTYQNIEFENKTFDLGEGIAYYLNTTQISNFNSKKEPTSSELLIDECVKNGDVILSYVENKEELLKLMLEKHFHDYDENKEDYWWRKFITKLPKEPNIDNLINFKDYDHTIRDRNNKRLTQLIYIDEISGITENNEYRNFDFKKVTEYLKKHPNIKNLKVITIPYYNSRFPGQRGLTFDVIFEGSWYDPYKEQYKSTSEIIFSEYDPLNIKQFSIPGEE